MHDVFISYEHESKAIADNICASLERSGIRCWYAPRDVMGDYATSIVEAINSAKVFVVVLNEMASKSIHVLNEVEQAHERLRQNENISIIPFKLDNETLSLAMGYYIKRLHWIDATNNSIEKAVDELRAQLYVILKISSPEEAPVKVERISNDYYKVNFKNDALEKRRLKIQRDLLKEFDQSVYDEIFSSGDNLCVLDVGCNDGSVIMDRIGTKPNIGKIIGLDYDEESVNLANGEYGGNHFVCYQCDLESDGLEECLARALSENKADYFDVIHISMVFLHLKNPNKVMRVLRKFAGPKCRFFIKDIDDGLNLAYPDEHSYFERIYKICDRNETSGFRKSGRQIFSCLHKCGCRDIALKRQGFNSSRMNYEEKQAMFETYFSFIIEDLKIMKDKYPTDQKLQDDYVWFKDNYDEIEEYFHKDDLLFSLGFMIYTAVK